MSFTDPFGCGPGSPCREILNQISTYNIPKYYPTANEYLSCFTEEQIPCSAITHCISGGTGGSVTPILIVSNAMSISNPVGGNEYIGDKSAGFNGSSWALTKSNFDYTTLNCGVPFPHTIDDSVTNAINVCGNLFVQGHRETINIHVKIYKFDCEEGSSTPTLTLLFTNILEVVEPAEGKVGVNKCWSMDVSNGEDKITECTTHFMISFTLIQEESGVTRIKSSYKATIEKVS